MQATDVRISARVRRALDEARVHAKSLPPKPPEDIMVVQASADPDDVEVRWVGHRHQMAPGEITITIAVVITALAMIAGVSM